MVSNHPELLAKGKYISTQAKDDELYYIHDEIGYNYRMTNLQAALGVAQLEQLDKFIEIKKRNYELYNNGLKNTKGLTMLDFNKNIQPNYWFYSLLINKDIYPLKVKEIIPYLKEKNIQVRPIWNLIHTQKPYRESRAYKIDRANYYLENVINIPCSSNLTEEEVNYIINVLSSI